MAYAVVIVPAKQDILRFGVRTQNLQIWKLGGVDYRTAISVVEYGRVGRHNVEAVAQLPAVIDPRVDIAQIMQRHQLRRAGSRRPITSYCRAAVFHGARRHHGIDLAANFRVVNVALKEVPGSARSSTLC